MGKDSALYDIVVRIDEKLDRVAEKVACMEGKQKGVAFMVKLLFPIVASIIVAMVISWAI